MRALLFIVLSILVAQASAAKPEISEEQAQQFAERCVVLSEMRAQQNGISLTHPTQSMIVAAEPSLTIVIIIGTSSPSWKRSGFNSEPIRMTQTCQNGEIQ